MPFATQDEFADFAHRHQAPLALFAYTAFTQLDRHVVMLTDTPRDLPADTLLHLEDRYCISVPASAFSRLELAPSPDDILAEYDPLYQIVLAAEVDEHLAILCINPVPPPYTAYLTDQNLNRPLDPQTDLKPFAYAYLPALAAFSYASFLQYGKGIVLISYNVPIRNATPDSIPLTDHAFCEYLTPDAYSELARLAQEPPDVTAPVLQQANTYDPERELYVVFDNGVESQPILLEPTRPFFYPSNQYALHQHNQDDERFNRPQRTDDEHKAFIDHYLSQIAVFAVQHFATYGRGLVYVESGTQTYLPALVLPPDTSYPLNQANTLHYVSLAQLGTEPGEFYGGDYAKQLVALYDPAQQVVILIPATQGTKVYRVGVITNDDTSIGDLYNQVRRDYNQATSVDFETSLATTLAQNLLEEHYDLLAAIAWQGYKTQGRGAVIMLDPTMTTDVLQGKHRTIAVADEMAFYADFPTYQTFPAANPDTANFIQTYDPQRSYILIRLDSRGYQHTTRITPPHTNPRQAYRRHHLELNTKYDN